MFQARAIFRRTHREHAPEPASTHSLAPRTRLRYYQVSRCNALRFHPWSLLRLHLPLTPRRVKSFARARDNARRFRSTQAPALVTISPAVAPRKQIRRSSARLPKLSPPSGSLSLIKCSSRQESSTVAPRAPFPPLFASFLTHDLSVSFPPCVLHPLSSSHAHATPRSSPSTLSADPLSAKILG